MKLIRNDLHKECLAGIDDGSWCEFFKDKDHTICQETTNDWLLEIHPIIDTVLGNDIPMLLQVELLPRGTNRKPVIHRLSQQSHHYLTC